MTPLETAFDAWLAFHAALGVDLESALNPGAADIAIERVEAAIGRELPADLRALYRIADGQADPFGARGATGGDGPRAAMFGRERFLSLDEALAEWRFWHDEIWLPEQAHGGFPPDHDVREGDPVDPVYWQPSWFTFAGSDGGNGYAVDLDPPRGGTYGQVVLVGSDEWERRVIASSVTELMAEAAARLDPDEPHRFVRDEGDARDRPQVSFDMDWRETPHVPPSAGELERAEARHETIETARRIEREDFDAWLGTRGLSGAEREAVLASVRPAFGDDPFGPRERAPADSAGAAPAGAVPTGSWMADDPLGYLSSLDLELFTSATVTAGEPVPATRLEALDLLHRWRLARGDWSELDYRRSRAVLERPRPEPVPGGAHASFFGSVRLEGEEIVVERSGPDGRRTFRFPAFERLIETVR